MEYCNKTESEGTSKAPENEIKVSLLLFILYILSYNIKKIKNMIKYI